MKVLFINILLFAVLNLAAQTNIPQNWHLLDLNDNGIPGISVEKAQKELLKNKKPKKEIIVAIIGSGIDTSHPKLTNTIWTNKNEIPNNGIDDDKNGYIDDINGWCFNCDKDNNPQQKVLYADVRTYLRWREKYKNIDTTKLSGDAKDQFEVYRIARQKVLFPQPNPLEVQARKLTKEKNPESIDTLKLFDYLERISKTSYPDSLLTSHFFKTFGNGSTFDNAANYVFDYALRRAKIKRGQFGEMMKMQLRSAPEMITINGFIGKEPVDSTDYRKVGDNPDDMITTFGNNGIYNKKYPEAAEHETFVAGIITAIAGDNVKLMPLITSGIERGSNGDKDIAFAIRYAVDNGANIINMSMGGINYMADYLVEAREAMEYAYQKNVLVIVSAGNDASTLENEKYLEGQSINGIERPNLIRVGGTSSRFNEQLLYTQTNYGRTKVDLFAPGEKIYSILPNNQYDTQSGTSFSTPCVVGVAALVWSYYPELSASQLKEILLTSTFKPNISVILPDGVAKTAFEDLSKSGGIVNAYNAIKIVFRTSKTKKGSR